MYLDCFACFTFKLRCFIFEKDGKFGSWNHDCSIWWLRKKNLFEGRMFYSKFGEIKVFKIISWQKFFLVGIVLNWYFENWYIDNLRQQPSIAYHMSCSRVSRTNSWYNFLFSLTSYSFRFGQCCNVLNYFKYRSYLNQPPPSSFF